MPDILSLAQPLLGDDDSESTQPLDRETLFARFIADDSVFGRPTGEAKRIRDIASGSRKPGGGIDVETARRFVGIADAADLDPAMAREVAHRVSMHLGALGRARAVMQQTAKGESLAQKMGEEGTLSNLEDVSRQAFARTRSGAQAALLAGQGLPVDDSVAPPDTNLAEQTAFGTTSEVLKLARLPFKAAEMAGVDITPELLSAPGIEAFNALAPPQTTAQSVFRSAAGTVPGLMVGAGAAGALGRLAILQAAPRAMRVAQLLAASGAQVIPNVEFQYRDFVKDGVDPTRAALFTLASAAMETATEALIPGVTRAVVGKKLRDLAEKQVKDATLAFVKKVGGSMGAEFGQEGIQSFLSGVLDFAARNPDKTLRDAIVAQVEDPEYREQLKVGALAGGLVGGGAGVVQATADTVARRDAARGMDPAKAERALAGLAAGLDAAPQPAAQTDAPVETPAPVETQQPQAPQTGQEAAGTLLQQAVQQPREAKGKTDVSDPLMTDETVARELDETESAVREDDQLPANAVVTRGKYGIQVSIPSADGGANIDIHRPTTQAEMAELMTQGDAGAIYDSINKTDVLFSNPKFDTSGRLDTAASAKGGTVARGQWLGMTPANQADLLRKNQMVSRGNMRFVSIDGQTVALISTAPGASQEVVEERNHRLVTGNLSDNQLAVMAAAVDRAVQAGLLKRSGATHAGKTASDLVRDSQFVEQSFQLYRTLTGPQAEAGYKKLGGDERGLLRRIIDSIKNFFAKVTRGANAVAKVRSSFDTAPVKGVVQDLATGKVAQQPQRTDMPVTPLQKEPVFARRQAAQDRANQQQQAAQEKVEAKAERAEAKAERAEKGRKREAQNSEKLAAEVASRKAEAAELREQVVAGEVASSLQVRKADLGVQKALLDAEKAEWQELMEIARQEADPAGVNAAKLEVKALAVAAKIVLAAQKRIDRAVASVQGGSQLAKDAKRAFIAGINAVVSQSKRAIADGRKKRAGLPKRAVAAAQRGFATGQKAAKAARAEAQQAGEAVDTPARKPALSPMPPRMPEWLDTETAAETAAETETAAEPAPLSEEELYALAQGDAEANAKQEASDALEAQAREEGLEPRKLRATRAKNRVASAIKAAGGVNPYEAEKAFGADAARELRKRGLLAPKRAREAEQGVEPTTDERRADELRGVLAEPLTDGDDIISQIKSMGGIVERTRRAGGEVVEARAGEYDGMPTQRLAPVDQVMVSEKKAGSGTSTADQMAVELADVGLGDGTTNTMWKLISEELTRRSELRDAKDKAKAELSELGPQVAGGIPLEAAMQTAGVETGAELLEVLRAEEAKAGEFMSVKRQGYDARPEASPNFRFWASPDDYGKAVVFTVENDQKGQVTPSPYAREADAMRALTNMRGKPGWKNATGWRVAAHVVETVKTDSENYTKLRKTADVYPPDEGGVIDRVGEGTGVVRPTSLYSIARAGQEEANAEKAMRKLGVPEREIRRVVKGLRAQNTLLKSLFGKYDDVLPGEEHGAKRPSAAGAPRGTFVRKNSDKLYMFSVDFTTSCIKRARYAVLLDAVLGEVKRPLTKHEELALRGLARAFELDAPCNYCYVDSARMAALLNVQGLMERVYGQGRESAKRPDRQAKLENARKSLKRRPLAQDDIDIGFLFDDGAVQNARLADKADPVGQHAAVYRYLLLAANDAKAKKVQGYEPSLGQILGLDAVKRRQLNATSGLRFQSWSDLSPDMLPDYIQAITEAQMAGLRSHVYAKVPALAEAFAETGQKINLSLFPMLNADGGMQLDADGNPVLDHAQSFPSWKPAQQLKAKYPNVGTVLVAPNRKVVQQAMLRDDIDYIVPFHASGMAAEAYKRFKWEEMKAIGAKSKSGSLPAVAREGAKDKNGYYKVRFANSLFYNYKTGSTDAEAFKKFAAFMRKHNVTLSKTFADFMAFAAKSGKPHAFMKLVKDTTRLDTPFEVVDASKTNYDAVDKAIEPFAEYVRKHGGERDKVTGMIGFSVPDTAIADATAFINEHEGASPAELYDAVAKKALEVREAREAARAEEDGDDPGPDGGRMSIRRQEGPLFSGSTAEQMEQIDSAPRQEGRVPDNLAKRTLGQLARRLQTRIDEGTDEPDPVALRMAEADPDAAADIAASHAADPGKLAAKFEREIAKGELPTANEHLALLLMLDQQAVKMERNLTAGNAAASAKQSALYARLGAADRSVGSFLGARLARLQERADDTEERRRADFFGAIYGPTTVALARSRQLMTKARKVAASKRPGSAGQAKALREQAAKILADGQIDSALVLKRLARAKRVDLKNLGELFKPENGKGEYFSALREVITAGQGPMIGQWLTSMALQGMFGLKTVAVQWTTNPLQAMVQGFESAIGATANTIFKREEGARIGDAKAVLSAGLKALQPALLDAGTAFLTGHSPTDLAAGKAGGAIVDRMGAGIGAMHAPSDAVYFGGSKASKAASLATTPILRAIGASDEMARAVHFRALLAGLALQQARSEGLLPSNPDFADRVAALTADPLPWMVDDALAGADERTFKEALPPKSITGALIRFVNAPREWLGHKGVKPGVLAVPFLGTIARVARQVLRRVPVVSEVALAKDVAVGGVEKDMAEARKQATRSVTAWTVALLLEAFSTGEGEDKELPIEGTPLERRWATGENTLSRERGTAGSFMGVPLNRLDPIGMAAVMTANVLNAIHGSGTEKGRDRGERLQRLTAKLTRDTLYKVFFEGIKETVFDAAEGEQMSAGKRIRATAMRMAGLKDTEDGIKPAGLLGTPFLPAVQQELDLALRGEPRKRAGTDQPSIGPFGGDRAEQDPGVGALVREAFGLRHTGEQRPELRAYANAWDAMQKAAAKEDPKLRDAFYTRPDRKVRVDGEDYELTEREYTRLLRELGAFNLEEIRSYGTPQELAKADPEDAAFVIEQLKRAATKEATAIKRDIIYDREAP